MAKFPLIQCLVRINGGKGERSSEVPKVGQDRITPAEMFVLLHLHGADGAVMEETILQPKITGEIEIGHNDLKQDLRNRYGAVVNTLFPGILPTEAPGVPDERATQRDDTPIMGKAALVAQYQAVVGKKPFGGWDEAELQRRIDEARKMTEAA